jgi:hypothetical protein
MNQNALFFVLSLLVCAYDVYVAIRSGGHNYIAWFLAAIMAIVAIFTLRQLVRRPNS